MLELAGCLSQHIALTPITTKIKPAANTPAKAKLAAAPVPVILYKKAEHMVSKSFRYLGAVSERDRQNIVQDSPPNLATTHKYMSIRAA